MCFRPCIMNQPCPLCEIVQEIALAGVSLNIVALFTGLPPTIAMSKKCLDPYFVNTFEDTWIWKVHLSTNVQFFIWKSCHDSITTSYHPFLHKFNYPIRLMMIFLPLLVCFVNMSALTNLKLANDGGLGPTFSHKDRDSFGWH